MEELEAGNGTAQDGGGEAARQELEELRGRLAEREAAERMALARLREALLASEPALDPGLVGGETLEQIESSFAAATAMAARLREALRREGAAQIPAGAGSRSPAGPRSPFEKIRAGLAGR